MDTDHDHNYDHDQTMESFGIMDTTEFPPNESLTLDPSVIFGPAPMALDGSPSPEVERTAVTTGKIPNGQRGSFARSPSYRQEMKPRASKVQKSEILPYSTSQTGLVYDVRMRFHVEVQPEQNNGVHPEDPRRIYAIYQELVDAGLVDDPVSPGASTLEYVLGRIPARFATKEEICAVHSERLYEWVLELKNWENEVLHDAGGELDSIYLSKNSPMCARLSAGGAIEACRAILNDQVKNSIAVIRPPGHHAEHDQPRGFCFFNNVPIAVKACQKEFPETCRKVMILDWDVHHGNGVQEAFYNDPNVLYVSLHVHQGGNFYPSGDYGDHTHCGEGPGLGKNVNIPWKTAGMTDGDYIYAFQRIVMPIAQDFNPDLVIVSAGFDAAEGDMLGKCHVTPAGYAHMTHALMSLANGKVAVCLEGGYNLRSIAVSALGVTRTLMGEPPDRLLETEPTSSGVDTVEMVLRTQSKFWPCLYPKNPADRLRNLNAIRVHDVIREWQSKALFDAHNMSSLFIARTGISKSFETQVLATPDYTSDRPLLLIFHDPPELSGLPDPRTQKLELHNTWLTDVVKSYIGWATKQGFSVIDVNIPKHYTGVEDDQEMQDEDSHQVRAKEALELANYIWENYVELYDRPQIFIMGVGAAYASIVQMLKSHDRFREQIGEDGKIFSFISDADPLHAYKSLTDDYLAERWYRHASCIFVAENHYIWERSKHKAPSKRWGTLVKSPYGDIQDMLKAHQEKVFEEILELTEEWRSARRSSLSPEHELSRMQTDLPALVLPPAIAKDAATLRAKSPSKFPPLGNFALQSPNGGPTSSPAQR